MVYYVEWETEPECGGSPLDYRFFTNKAEAKKFIRNNVRGFPSQFKRVQLPTKKGDWVEFLSGIVTSPEGFFEGMGFAYGSEEVSHDA